MDWRRFVMEWGWLGMAIPLLALVGTTFYSITQDNRGWKKVQSKMGESRRASLEEQHEDIKDSIKVGTEDIEKTVVSKTDSIEKVIVDKTSNIYTKVDNIDKITVKNEALYQSLNLDQKEVRNNVNKLVLDWEKTISENKELKSINEKLLEKVSFLKESSFETRMETKDIKEKLDKLIVTNKIILEENQELKNKITELEKENKNLYCKIQGSNYHNENEDDMEI